jgi:hypothetical protein
MEHRSAKAQVDVDVIEIRGTKKRARITEAKTPFLTAVQYILGMYRDYWPLSDRRIHYYLLNDPPLKHAAKPQSIYVNDCDSYKSLIDLLTRGRLAGVLPWRAIDDSTRPTSVWGFPRNAGEFVRKELDGFLKGYYRDYMQSQPNQIEIIGEKDTLTSIIRPVAEEYCIPMTIGRGYCSLPPRYRMAERFKRSGKEQLILLALGDLDPEGEDIGHSFARSMRDDFGITDIVPMKVALTPAQVQELNLPPNRLKAKAGSSRRKGFVERHGEDVYEMEAVLPEDTQGILRKAIDSVIDVDLFNQEVSAEEQEAARLLGTRRSVRRLLAESSVLDEAEGGVE